MTTTPRPDLVPAPETRPSPGATVAVLVLGAAIGLVIVALLGRIVEALA